MQLRYERKVVLVAVGVFVCLVAIGCDGSSKAPIPSANSWRFVIFGDTRGDFDPAKKPPYDPGTATGVSLVLPQIATKIAAMRPEFVLHVGDLVCGEAYKVSVQLGLTPPGSEIPYDRQFRSSKAAMQPITAANIPFYSVRGNHEASCMNLLNGPPDPELLAAYVQAYGQYMPQNNPSQRGLTYSFSHKQVTVVAVDQYSDPVLPEPAPVPWPAPANPDWGTNFWGFHTIDQEWVRAQLQAATTPFKIVLAHEPIFVATGAPFSSTGTGYHWPKEQFYGPARFGGETARQQFVNMMGSNGVQLYAVGHVHNLTVGSFEDSAGHTMYQLTAGNGGAFPLTSAPDPPDPEPALHGVQSEMHRPGFTLVTVDPDGNTMLMEYYVTSMNGSGWSKESFTTRIAGPK